MIQKALPLLGRKSRRVKTKKPFVPVASALVLVGATYSTDPSPVLVLTFDRAIDLSGLFGDAIVVGDGASMQSLAATGTVTAVGADGVALEMVPIGGWSPGPILLTAGADSGIVAQDDGGTWAGAEGIELPFP